MKFIVLLPFFQPNSCRFYNWTSHLLVCLINTIFFYFLQSTSSFFPSKVFSPCTCRERAWKWISHFTQKKCFNNKSFKILPQITEFYKRISYTIHFYSHNLCFTIMEHPQLPSCKDACLSLFEISTKDAEVVKHKLNAFLFCKNLYKTSSQCFSNVFNIRTSWVPGKGQS